MTFNIQHILEYSRNAKNIFELSEFSLAPSLFLFNLYMYSTSNDNKPGFFFWISFVVYQEIEKETVLILNVSEQKIELSHTEHSFMLT